MPDDSRNGAEPYMTVREMVTEIRRDLKELRGEVATRKELEDLREDHEPRIRFVEKWVNAVPLTAFVAIGGVVAAFIR